jgi:hypothetical protein
MRRIQVENFEANVTKREFLKKATYVVPAVLTLAAAPSFAAAGSSSKGGNKYKKPKKPKKNGKHSYYEAPKTTGHS